MVVTRYIEPATCYSASQQFHSTDSESTVARFTFHSFRQYVYLKPTSPFLYTPHQSSLNFIPEILELIHIATKPVKAVTMKRQARAK